MSTSSRTRNRVQIKRTTSEIVLNSFGQEYSTINDLYGDDKVVNGKTEYHRGLKTGVLVTVLIPPISMYRRIPSFSNLSFLKGLPYISGADQEKIHNSMTLYSQEIRKTNAKLRSLRKELAQVKRITPRGLVEERKIARIESQIAALEKSLGAGVGGLLAKYSSRFDITDFITSLSWSSDKERGSVEVSINLDNVGGIFNYLPVGTKVTIWRRKNLKNWTAASEFGARWQPYIHCYIGEKTREADGRNQTMSISCWDRMAYFGANNLAKKVYAKNSKHPEGWSPREITIDICKRAGIPYTPSKIPVYVVQPGTAGYPNGIKWPRLKRFEASEGSVAQALSDAWNDSLKRLPNKHRRDYTYHTRRGNLEVEVVSPPGKWLKGIDFNTERKVLHYSDNDGIESAQLSEKITDYTFTVLNARGTITKRVKNPTTRRMETKKTKIKGTYKADSITLQALGEKSTTKTFKKRFDSKAEFDKYCKNWIEERSRPKYTLQIKAKGILGMWPIRYVHISSRYLGIRGFFSIQSISYEVTSGFINVDITLSLTRRVFVNGYKYYDKYPVDPETNLNAWY